MLADEVGDDAQLIAALMQALDDLHTAVHHHPASLGLPVLEAQLMTHLPDADRVIIRQQPFAPQFLVPGFFVLAQCPLAVRLIAFLHDLVKCFIGQFRSCDLRQLPAGVAQVGFVLQSDPQGSA